MSCHVWYYWKGFYKTRNNAKICLIISCFYRDLTNINERFSFLNLPFLFQYIFPSSVRARYNLFKVALISKPFQLAKHITQLKTCFKVS